MRLRAALAPDAQALAELINEIIARGGTTAHLRPFDAARMCGHYIAPARGIACTLAEDAGRVLGFQALEWCDPNWPGPDALPADWAVIASFVEPGAQGRGVGQALWTVTRRAAEVAGVRTIDATIRADNAGGLAFYGSLGFNEYARRAAAPLSDGTLVDRVSKRFDLSPGSGRDKAG